MWLLVLLVAVSVVVTVVARRRHTDERDSVDAQQRRIDALRTAVGHHDDPSDLGSGSGGLGGTGLSLRGPRTERRSTRSMLGTVLVAVAVVIAGVAIYAIAAGWDSNSQAENDAGGTEQPAASSSTSTSTSTSSTTTTTKPAVPTILSTDGGSVVVTVPSGPYALHIAAHDPCWTQIERADGTVVQTQTMQSGDVIDLNESGALTIRFGNPGGVELSVDGTVLTLPAGTGNAMEVALLPAT